MNTLLKVLTPTLLLAASCSAMSLVHTPAWTEAYEEPVYRSVPYSVEHVHHGFFHDSVTYTTEVRSVLDHYETRTVTHADAYTQIDDRGIAVAIPVETFHTYMTGRVVTLRPGARTTFHTNSRMTAGDPNDQVLDLGPTVVVVAPAPVVVPAPVIIQPAPVYVEPAPIIIERRDPAVIIDVRGHRRW